jgi:hypothetical protein
MQRVFNTMPHIPVYSGRAIMTLERYLSPNHSPTEKVWGFVNTYLQVPIEQIVGGDGVLLGWRPGGGGVGDGDREGEDGGGEEQAANREEMEAGGEAVDSGGSSMCSEALMDGT